MSSTRVSASCNRVPVIDGHTASVFVEFANKPAPSVEAIKSALASYSSGTFETLLATAPLRPIILATQDDRPQPRLDILAGNGNSVVIGRVRKCNVLDVKFTLLSHNTILGAAGSSILNAEIAHAKGLIKK